jgi:hypothetical protein
MAPTLYLHIGIQKTGSTAVQNVCMDNQERLKRSGILFPSAGFARGSPRGPTATAGHRRLLRFMRRPDKMPLHPEARALLDEIEAANCDVIVLSCEVFSAPGKRKVVSGLEWLMKQGFDARIVAYLRRQDSWLDSFYRQLLKRDGWIRGEARSIEDFWRSEGSDWLDYRSRLRPWVEAVGAENAIIRSYEDAQDRGGVVGDFLAAIGADASELDMSRASETFNPSVPSSAADFLRAFNVVADSGFALKADLLKAICETALFNRSRGSLVSPELWAELRSTYAKENEELRRAWVSGPSSRLSFEGGAPSELSEQAVTYSDSLLLLEALLPHSGSPAIARGGELRDDQDLSRESEAGRSSTIT